MNKTIVILACCTAIGSIAFAQGKPADKPGATPAAASAKPDKPEKAEKAAKPAGAPGAKPGEPGAKPAKAGEPGAKPAAGPAAAAAAPAMPPPPKPPAELEENFKYFIGAWKCETTFPAGAMGAGSPEVKGKTTVKFKKANGGWYVQGDYAMAKTKTSPAMKGSFMISYHPVAKMFAMTGMDDMGSATFETASGYAGETITFTGEGFTMGQKAKIRETMTRMPDTKGASHKYEVDTGKGFQVMGEDVCKR